MNASLPTPVTVLVDTFSSRPDVRAIALGGSRASRQDDAQSDYNLYVFIEHEIPERERRDLALQFDPEPEISNPWFGLEDAWSDGTTSIDVSYWDPRDFENSLRQVIEHHRPSLGYSTSFWFTMRHAIPLYDRSGWFARMNSLASTPYPEALRDAIVAHHAPLLRNASASYRHQIELAIERNDAVSVNHRVAAFLASIFDIVFALNYMLHPGEKRQMAWITTLKEHIPPTFEQHVNDLLAASGENVLDAVDVLCDDVDTMILMSQQSNP